MTDRHLYCCLVAFIGMVLLLGHQVFMHDDDDGAERAEHSVWPGPMTDDEGNRRIVKMNDMTPVVLWSSGGPPATGVVFKTDDGAVVGRVCFGERDGAWVMDVGEACR